MAKHNPRKSGKTFTWCIHHKAWCIHTEEEYKEDNQWVSLGMVQATLQMDEACLIAGL